MSKQNRKTRVTEDLQTCYESLMRLEKDYEVDYKKYAEICRNIKTSDSNHVLRHNCAEAKTMYDYSSSLKKKAKNGLYECQVAKMSIQQALEALLKGHPGSRTEDLRRTQTWSEDICFQAHARNKDQCKRDELCYFREDPDTDLGMCREKWTSKGNPFMAADISADQEPRESRLRRAPKHPQR
jgi:hypothetical protein